jgi:hypothetical protein
MLGRIRSESVAAHAASTLPNVPCVTCGLSRMNAAATARLLLRRRPVAFLLTGTSLPRRHRLTITPQPAASGSGLALGCGQPGIVAETRLMPRQPLDHHLPAHVLALDLDAAQRAAVLVAAIVLHRHDLAHRQLG